MLLHYATESSCAAQTIDMLIPQNADINIYVKDGRNRTALHHAAAAGNVGAVEKLLELGEDAGSSGADVDGRNALQLAARCGRSAVVDVLTACCGF